MRVDDFKYRFTDQPNGWLGATVKVDWPILTNLRLDPYERTGIYNGRDNGSIAYYNNTTGTNPLTGLPCTGPGALSISGAGTLPGTTPPPLNGSDIGTASGTVQIPTFPSVFQPGGTAGAC